MLENYSPLTSVRFFCFCRNSITGLHLLYQEKVEHVQGLL
jgi:hypothetical protein